MEFIGGLVIIIPFFFMDTKGSHEIELDALTARRKMLKVYFAENGCSVANPSASSVIKPDGVTQCGLCGLANSDQWTRIGDKFVCLDCLQKMEAPKKKSKSSSIVY